MSVTDFSWKQQGQQGGEMQFITVITLLLSPTPPRPTGIVWG